MSIKFILNNEHLHIQTHTLSKITFSALVSTEMIKLNLKENIIEI